MTADIILYEGPRDLEDVTARRPVLFLAEPKAAERFWEFFTANIRNRHTRRAYYTAVCRFSQWCDGRGLHELARVKPMHVAAFIEELGRTLSKPTVKQSLAALRMLFDWMVVGHVMDVNPAHAVRGPTHRVKKGKTPGSALHVMLANRFYATVDQKHRLRGWRSTEIHGYPRRVSTVSIIQV
jgi:site-specific recombinase XerD